MAESFLQQIVIEAVGSESYGLSFLPGVEIPDTPENETRWREFLGTLSSKTRVLRDEDGEVGIPYRDGVWLRDLIFADDVRSFFIIPDITEVRGSVLAYGARVRNRHFDHALRIAGSLAAPQDLFQDDPPPVEIGGDVVLTDVKYPQELSIAPDRLLAWGLRGGARVRLRRAEFVFEIERHGEAEAWVLRDTRSGAVFVWGGERWDPSDRSRLDPELLGEILARMLRLRKFLGLSSDFLINSPRKTGYNLRRLERYLSLVQTSLAHEALRRGRSAADGPDDGSGAEARQTAEEAAVAEGIELLHDLESNVAAENTDPPNIRILLDRLDDAMLERLREACAVPRARLDEDAVRRDMALLEGLTGEGQTLNELFASGAAFAAFLSAVLRSRGARRSLLDLLREVAGRAREMLDGFGLRGTLGLADLLRAPGRVLSSLHDRADGDRELEAYVSETRSALEALDARAPRDMVRAVCACPGFHCEECAPEDKRLLSRLYAFTGSIDDLPVDPALSLEVYLGQLTSPVAATLERVREHLRSGKEAPVDVAIVTANLLESKPSNFIAFLSRRMRWDLGVIRQFNALSRERGQAPAERPRVRPPEGTAPELQRALFTRVNRISLLLGFGKELLEPVESAYRQNLGKVVQLLQLCHDQIAPDGPEAVQRRELFANLTGLLRALLAASAAGDDRTVERLLEAVSDDLLREVDRALAAPRPRIDPTPVRRDIATLKDLQRRTLTLDAVFGGTDKALLFLETMLKSPEMKRAVYERLGELNLRLQDVIRTGELTHLPTIHGLLRDFNGRALRMRREISSPEGAAALDGLFDAAAELRALSARDLVTDLLRRFRETPPGPQTDDRLLLVRLAGFRTGGVGLLQLDPDQGLALLRSRLMSPGRKILDGLEASGLLAGKSLPRVMAMVLGQLTTRADLLQVYNAVTRS